MVFIVQFLFRTVILMQNIQHKKQCDQKKQDEAGEKNIIGDGLVQLCYFFVGRPDRQKRKDAAAHEQHQRHGSQFVHVCAARQMQYAQRR